jgi:hypothetical protein
LRATNRIFVGGAAAVRDVQHLNEKGRRSGWNGGPDQDARW